jgi:hypothetical protein
MVPLFGQGMAGAQQAIASGEVPAGLARQTLMVAKEIAQRAIARGIDKGGVQAVRLKIIQEALKKIRATPLIPAILIASRNWFI